MSDAEWTPAPDQRCCGTCRHMETLDTDDGWGAAYQCHVIATSPVLTKKGISAGVARWWGSACVSFERKEP